MLSSAKCAEDDPETCCICGCEEDLIDTWTEEFSLFLEQLEESIPDSEEMSKRCLRFLCGVCRGKLSDVDQLMEAFEEFPQLNEHNHRTKEEHTKQVDDLNSVIVKEEENLYKEDINVLPFIEIISDDDEEEKVGLGETSNLKQKEKDLDISKTEKNKFAEYNCKLCNKKYLNQYALTKHMDHKHTGEMKFKCDQCPQAFKFNTNLIKHKLGHSRDRPFVCQICSKAFLKKSALNNHSVVHNIEKEHLCNVCGIRFKHEKSFLDHLQRHLGHHREKKPFVCEICSCGFTVKGNLKNHMYTHTQNWPFQCDICKKGFAKTSQLILHMSVHSYEMNYKCSICKKQFKTKQILHRHQKIH